MHSSSASKSHREKKKSDPHAHRAGEQMSKRTRHASVIGVFFLFLGWRSEERTASNLLEEDIQRADGNADEDDKQYEVHVTLHARKQPRATSIR
jgi:hypothetical protein